MIFNEDDIRSFRRLIYTGRDVEFCASLLEAIEKLERKVDLNYRLQKEGYEDEIAKLRRTINELQTKVANSSRR